MKESKFYGGLVCAFVRLYGNVFHSRLFDQH